jgi:hypothetical protein
LIPDGPFPARGLIGALAHLVKLGAVRDLDQSPSWFYSIPCILQTISKAKRDVQEFAKEIVHWVGRIRSAFAHGNGGRFTEETWKNLEEMRCAYIQPQFHHRSTNSNLFYLDLGSL